MSPRVCKKGLPNAGSWRGNPGKPRQAKQVFYDVEKGRRHQPGGGLDYGPLQVFAGWGESQQSKKEDTAVGGGYKVN